MGIYDVKKKIVLVVFFLILLPIVFAETIFDENSETTCDSTGLCQVQIYQQQRYYKEEGEWTYLNKTFDTVNCKGYDFCVDKNLYQFYLNNDDLNSTYEVNGENFTFSLLNMFGKKVFTKNLEFEGSVGTFKNIVPNADLEFQVLAGEVKETIIVHKPLPIFATSIQGIGNNKKIVFGLDNKLDYIDKGNSITINNTGSIGQLIMYDDNDKLIGLYNYTLAYKNGKPQASVSIDVGDYNSWEYPIRIDPSVAVNVTSRYVVTIRREFIPPGGLNFVRNNGGVRFNIGHSVVTAGGTRNTFRGDQGFNVSSVPDTAQVLAMNYSLHVLRTANNFFNANLSLWHMAVNNETAQTEGTYYTNIGNEDKIGDYFHISGAGTRHNFDMINATGSFEKNISGGSDLWNFGLALTNTATPDIEMEEWIYATHDNANDARHPRLTIVYRVSKVPFRSRFWNTETVNVLEDSNSPSFVRHNGFMSRFWNTFVGWIGLS